MDSCIAMDLDTGIKCVAVGDGEVGKTCMLVSYSTNEFPTVHVPTIFDNYAVKVVAKGESYTLMLFDTAGQEDYDRLRLLAYPGTDAFLLCFSVVAPSSFENVTQRWVPELRQHCPNAAILLVGTQCDLRQDTKTLENLEKDKEAPVPRDKAIRLAKKIGAVRYVECSALTREGLKGVFDQAILSVIDPPVRRFKGWRKLLCSAGVKG